MGIGLGRFLLKHRLRLVGWPTGIMIPKSAKEMAAPLQSNDPGITNAFHMGIYLVLAMVANPDEGHTDRLQIKKLTDAQGPCSIL